MKLTVKDALSCLEDRSNEDEIKVTSKIINQDTCEHKDTKQLKCKAGQLTVCRSCGKTWGYKKK